MALNFPDSPTLNQVYTDTTSGFSYQWNGSVWISYAAASSSQIKTLDDISGSFNGSTQSFALTSGGISLAPANAQSLIINLGGVVQDPTDDYSVSGTNIVFSTAPDAGLTFSGVSLGPAVPVSTIPDGTVTDGSLRISTTAVVGAATTFTEDLVVSGDARITGILTVGTSSITLDGSNNTINVGTGVTIYGNTGIVSATRFVGDGSGLTGAGSTVADDTSTNATFYPVLTQSTSGIVTATKVSTSKLSFNPSTGTLTATKLLGDGSGLTGVSAGATVADDTSTNQTFYPVFTQATSGIVTATKVSTTKLSFNPLSGTLNASNFSGAGVNLTGVITATSFDFPVQVLTFSPTDGSTANSIETDIVITFNQGIAKGTGNIELRSGSAGGSVLQTISVGSTAVTISGAQVTINPPSTLPINTDVYVVIPSGAFKSAYNTNYAGTSTYNFTTTDDSVTTYSPANGATNVTYETSITLTFPFAPVRGTGTVELRRGSVGGTLLESFDATTSNRISVSGNQWIIDPTNNFPAGDSIYLIIPSTAIINYAGLNIGGGTKSYSFNTASISNISFNPTNDSSSIDAFTNITLTFNNVPERGTGNIELRQDSASGGLVESYNVATNVSNISISGNDLIINPSNFLPAGRKIFVIVPSTAITSFAGLTIGGGTVPYGFTTKTLSLWGWGRGGTPVPVNNTTGYSSPVQIPGTNWDSITIRPNSATATKTDGTLWSWGFGTYGETTDTTSRSSPIQIPGTTWEYVTGSYNSVFGIKTDGTLWAWGRSDTVGQLGLNDLVNRSSPTQIPGTTWSVVSNYNKNTLAQKSDGTLWSWGYNRFGALGLNNTIYASSPVQIPGTTWTNSIFRGDGCGYGLKSDGTLWAWGFASAGEHAQNNRTYFSSPRQIPGTNWNYINGGRNFAFGIKTDGTLWSWGSNNRGQLGLNNTTYSSSPVQIPGTNWRFAIGGREHTLAVKTDGTLWVWGVNNFSELPTNNTISYSSPVQVPGTTWFTASGSYRASLATKTN